MQDDEGSNEPPIDQYDTPTHRANIAQLRVDDLDAMLEVIRARRLERVQKLEAIAKVRSDEARLELFMKYERLYRSAKKSLTRVEAEETKAEAAIHKLRMCVMAIQMEVSEDA
jgi:hypothetical protein